MASGCSLFQIKSDDEYKHVPEYNRPESQFVSLDFFTRVKKEQQKISSLFIFEKKNTAIGMSG